MNNMVNEKYSERFNRNVKKNLSDQIVANQVDARSFVDMYKSCMKLSEGFYEFAKRSLKRNPMLGTEIFYDAAKEEDTARDYAARARACAAKAGQIDQFGIDCFSIKTLTSPNTVSEGIEESLRE